MLKAKLFRPYQVDGVKWMLGREIISPKDHPGGFMCDEMGLGKTVQTIATIVFNKVPKTLIVVPSSIVSQWIQEIHAHSTLTVSELKKNPPDTDVYITTYGMLSKKGRLYDTLTGTHWNRVVLDEAHELRNPDSKRFNVLLELECDIRWILTGTPVFNSKKDYSTLLRFLTKDTKFYGLHKSIILRRTKSDLVKHDVSLAIPPCEFECIDIERYPEEEFGYRQVFNNFAEKVRTADNTEIAMVVLEGFLRMRQYSTNPEVYHYSRPEMGPYLGRCKKIDELSRMISEHPTEKTLVFCQFIREMDIIQDTLYPTQIFRLDGSTEDKSSEIERFKNHPGGCVFLIQIKAGGQGLNLQEATRVYINSPAWNPATELQAISRSHRKGQTKRVVIKKLVYVSSSDIPSIDEAIVELQDHKSMVCSEVLNDPRLAEQLPKLKRRTNMVRVFRKFFLS